MNEQLKTFLGRFDDKYPHQLEAKFPRIVDKIVEQWKSPGKNTAYFSELLIDKRGGRQGFPPDIAREIFLLSVTYDSIHGEQATTGDIWDNDQQEAQREIEQLNLKFIPSYFLKAVESADAGHVVLFLKAGMSVDVRDDRDWTPLMVAAFNGNEAMAKLLILHGADVQARDRGGYTPLHWASLNGYKDVVRLLLSKNVDCNTRSNFGWTPLLQAASKGHAAVTAILLDADADPNFASVDGWTPLHKAVANQHAKIVALLLNAGASVLVRHQDGSTPLSLAEKGNFSQIIELLRRSTR